MNDGDRKAIEQTLSIWRELAETGAGCKPAMADKYYSGCPLCERHRPRYSDACGECPLKARLGEDKEDGRFCMPEYYVWERYRGFEDGAARRKEAAAKIVAALEGSLVG